jgi:hypothetical protein
MHSGRVRAEDKNDLTDLWSMAGQGLDRGAAGAELNGAAQRLAWRLNGQRRARLSLYHRFILDLQDA